MVVCRVVAVALFSLFLCFTQTLAASGDTAAGIPLRVESDGLVSLEVRINGQGPFRFMLDTGSNVSAVSGKVAQALKLQQTGRTALITTAGRGSRPVVTFEELVVGTAEKRNLTATVLDDSDLASLIGHVDGILGQDFLFDQNYILDYRHKRLIWAEADDDSDGLSLALRPEEGRWLAALPQDKSGQRVAWLVPDSGAAALVLFDRGTEPAFQIQPVACCVSTGTVSGSGNARLALAPEFRVGSRTLRDRQVVVVSRPAANAPGGDGLLPLSMFSRVSFHAREQMLRVTF